MVTVRKDLNITFPISVLLERGRVVKKNLVHKNEMGGLVKNFIFQHKWKTVACPGFISRGRKKNLGRQNRARSAQFFSSSPTLYYFSGAEQTRGGLIILLYLEKEGGTSNNRSLSKPQLTVLLCVNAMHFLIGYSGVSRNYFSRDRKKY